jgi:hypothetical protein
MLPSLLVAALLLMLLAETCWFVLAKARWVVSSLFLLATVSLDAQAPWKSRLGRALAAALARMLPWLLVRAVAAVVA